MTRFCPLCKFTIKKESEDIYGDQYICKPQSRDHHYSELVKNDELLRFKIRIRDSISDIYLHVHLKDNYSEVWTQAGDVGGRIRINKSIVFDFSDRELLKNKLRTYLLIS